MIDETVLSESPIIRRYLCFEDVKYPLVRPHENVGRNEESHIHLKNQEISYHHAQIKVGASNVFIRDLNSKNGTKLNKENLSPRFYYQIHNNDMIEFGNCLEAKFIEEENEPKKNNQEENKKKEKNFTNNVMTSNVSTQTDQEDEIEESSFIDNDNMANNVSTVTDQNENEIGKKNLTNEDENIGIDRTENSNFEEEIEQIRDDHNEPNDYSLNLSLLYLEDDNNVDINEMEEVNNNSDLNTLQVKSSVRRSGYFLRSKTKNKKI